MKIAYNKSQRKEERKNRRMKRVRDMVLSNDDIKYKGPLSYRYLRIIAWICFALGQISVFVTLAHVLSIEGFVNDVGETFINLFATLSTPLFLVASFGLVLSRQKNYKQLMLTYGLGFIGFALAVIVIYYRYVNGLLIAAGFDGSSEMLHSIELFISRRVQLNVFADLFMFVLFQFFLCYTPKKIFVGKKLLIFRLFAILPIAYIIVSYILIVLLGLSIISVPFFIFPFLTTKSPIVFSIFVVVTLWIKYREIVFAKYGITKEEYKKYLATNRNSLSFSVHLSIIIAVFIAIDFILSVVLLVAFVVSQQMSIDEGIAIVMGAFKLGQTAPLLIAIPFILLYSYTKKHKNTLIDIFIPVIGVSLIALVYLESLYQFISYLSSSFGG